VSFTLPPASITALVGPNGAGKSTLIRSCLGFERPDAGRVLVFGADPMHDRSNAVNSIGYVPQGAALYRGLSINDHLTMAEAARRSFDRAYALSRIDHAGLAPERNVGDLSSGEQAQVALAIALGTRAPLLLMDEPMASLDPLARRDFLTILTASVRDSGVTVLLSSHIVTDMEQACDRLLVLAAGRVVLDSDVPGARARFRVAPATGSVDSPAVGEFTDASGRHLALHSDPTAGDPATLEEIVLGHLASGRTRRPVVQ
jgi:ABC-2 type transport system ATP-binding protein